MHEGALAAILDAADEGFVVFGRDGRCVHAGRRIGDFFGFDPASIVGRAEADVLRLLAAACEEPDAVSQLARVAAGPAAQVVELEVQRPRPRTVRVQTTVVRQGGQPAGWLGIVRDVTRERSAERRAHQLLVRLEQITATDALTQLPNRRRFIEELDREHGRSARAWDSYAVLRIDIDDLHRHNQELGHPRGDQILETVAERLRDGRREYDLIARFEEDEFIVLLPGADATAARVVAERMRDAVAKVPIPLGEPCRVTVGVGAAVWMPPSGEMGPDVVRRAGEALREAKKTGRSAIRVEGESTGAPPTKAT